MPSHIPEWSQSKIFYKDFYNENYKTLPREVEDLIKYRDISF